MIIHHSTRFDKNYQKRIAFNAKTVHQFQNRLELLLKNPRHPLLKNHRLKGKLAEYRAISITGDIRLIYRFEPEALYYSMTSAPTIRCINKILVENFYNVTSPSFEEG